MNNIPTTHELNTFKIKAWTLTLTYIYLHVFTFMCLCIKYLYLYVYICIFLLNIPSSCCTQHASFLRNLYRHKKYIKRQTIFFQIFFFFLPKFSTKYFPRKWFLLSLCDSESLEVVGMSFRYKFWLERITIFTAEHQFQCLLKQRFYMLHF